jgi:elongation factor 1-beta
MGIALITLKIMPESPQVDLNKIQEETKHRLEKEGAKNILFEIVPIAFGLKSIKVKFAWPEEKGTDTAEQLLSSIENISSIEIEDFRRAFG